MQWEGPEGEIGHHRLSFSARSGRVVALLIILLGLLFLLSSGVRADFDLSVTRLSDQDSTCDIEPRAGISDDGQWLAVVWIRGKGTNGGCVSRGQAQIRWATGASGGASGWQGPHTFSLPSGACAVHTDVDVVGATAHVVVSYWQPCDVPQANSGIRHFTCDLGAGRCSVEEDAVTQAGSEDLRLSDARIAADDRGRLHLVYSRASHGLVGGDIFYSRYVNGAWTSPVLVSTGVKLDGFYRPAVAASGDRVHITWERHRPLSGDERHLTDVQYRYCVASTGACPESGLITYLYPYQDPLGDVTDALPVVAAEGNRVMLSWNVCADFDPNPPCQSFYLLYARSDDNGTTFSRQPKEVGTDYLLGYLQREYAGSDNGVELVNQYAAYARPVIELDKVGLPYATWQMSTTQGFVISTTYAIAATSEGFDWGAEPDWQLGEGEDARIAPTILLPDENGMHFFYMLAWQKQVGSQQASRSQIYYDYRGERRPLLVSETVSTTHPLPAERAVQLRVRVQDSTGMDMPGKRVAFLTDHGSFDYLGFGTRQAEAVSDAQGIATLTLYSNMTGTAHCRAWIDSISNGMWDAGEPTTTFTQTWVDSLSPTVQVGVAWAAPGDLMTATLEHHAYEIPSFAGAAAQYVLWWCPGATQVAGPLSVEVESWAKQDLVVQVPWNAGNGIYYLESRVDEEGTAPCDGSDYVARSSDIQVNTSPPPGPWLMVGDNRPAPGASITTTLQDHEAGNYELWWCPASSGAAPISQKVGDVTVDPGTEPTETFSVPVGVQGLYRLETHTGAGASCGDTRTRYAVSALLAPLSEVFLPLIMCTSR